jgi:hypothetical protein
MPDGPQVLIPFDRREALTLQQAAHRAMRTVETMRRWAALYDLGRLISGRWLISRVALAMHLDGDRKALQAYLAGDRAGPLVRPYYEREDLGTLQQELPANR